MAEEDQEEEIKEVEEKKEEERTGYFGLRGCAPPTSIFILIMVLLIYGTSKLF